MAMVETAARMRMPQDSRREQLIAAAITAIGEHGLSNLTLGKVASLAGLTAGMVNFHFESKQDLLQATLESVAGEYRAICEQAVAAAGRHPADALMALVRASFDERVAQPDKLAVWYAFWGESQARNDYMRICGASDQAFYDSVRALVAELAVDAPILDTRAAALGLCGLIDALSQEALAVRGDFDRPGAVETCRRYLANLFPARFGQSVPPPALHAVPRPTTDLPLTLPAWAYCREDVFRAEMEHIHLPAWQLVCHVSEMPGVGDYVTFEAFGERAFAIRGRDGAIRAFHNVCRHRGHAVVEGRSGTSRGVLRCPYHAWCYDPATGELKAIAAEKTFPPFDNGEFGLKPIECEVFCGFVFLRFRAGGPSVAARYAVHAEELGRCRLEEMVPIGEYWMGDAPADWKNVWDNYLEDYHFPTGHPGLSGLMDAAYDRQPDDAHRTIRLSHAMRETPKGGWSNRMYARVLPQAAHLPDELARRWSYFFLYPSASIETYPDMVDFFHIVPLGPGRSALRWRAFGLPGADRATRAARWLNRRINLQVHNEDSALVESVQKGLATSAYGVGLLGEKEVNVRAFQNWIREDVPMLR
jgi:phenylpropionate dioxygenase-like ring-hydroxylating dioxygenase large terminal subunit/AcrR family transcriptional regulator